MPDGSVKYLHVVAHPNAGQARLSCSAFPRSARACHDRYAYLVHWEAVSDEGLAIHKGRTQRPGGFNRKDNDWEDVAEAVRIAPRGLLLLRRPAVFQLPWREARFRNDIVTGVGGKQILVEDSSGNSVELFEPTAPQARLRN
jgi:hypothetical protein